MKYVDFYSLVSEGGPELLDRGLFTVTGRFLGYATNNEEKYKHLRNEHIHILFTDRRDNPCTKPVGETPKLHGVEGKILKPWVVGVHEEWLPGLARQMCMCKSCRRVVEEEQQFKHV